MLDFRPWTIRLYGDRITLPKPLIRAQHCVFERDRRPPSQRESADESNASNGMPSGFDVSNRSSRWKPTTSLIRSTRAEVRIGTATGRCAGLPLISPKQAVVTASILLIK